jgi:hypothetical protein
MKPRTHEALCALVSLLAASACALRDPCDDGQYEDHGACYPILGSMLDAGSVMDAAAEGDGGTSVASTDPYEGFGKPCRTHADCKVPSPVCGAPERPVCTAIQCLPKPEICPPTWTCLDIRAYSSDPNFNSACLLLGP